MQPESNHQAPLTPVPSGPATPNDPSVVSSAARTCLSLGIFLTVILAMIFAFSGLSSSTDIIFSISYLLCALTMTGLGYKMKRSTDIQSAKSLLLYAIIVATLLLALGVAKSIVAQTGSLGIAGFFGLVTAIYLVVVRARLH